MKNQKITPFLQEYQLIEDSDLTAIEMLGHATSSRDRLMILRSLLFEAKNIATLSSELNIPISSVMRHVDILAKANLIAIVYQPGPKGHTKLCYITAQKFSVQLLSSTKKKSEKAYSIEMPIGLFTNCNISDPCGIISATEIISMDMPSSFFHPKRAEAELIYFTSGYVTYSFPPAPINQPNFSKIKFSFEICSEAAGWNNHWPSDITLWVNGLEILTFTSPGDYGGERGRYSPDFWPTSSTQYGLFYRLTIAKDGVFFNSTFQHNRITYKDLNISSNSNIELRIGIKDDAKYVGGINLFGKNFGNHPQAIIMTLS